MTSGRQPRAAEALLVFLRTTLFCRVVYIFMLECVGNASTVKAVGMQSPVL